MNLEKEMLEAVKLHTDGLEQLMSQNELSYQCAAIAREYALKFAKFLIQPDESYPEFDVDVQKDLEIFEKEHEKQ